MGQNSLPALDTALTGRKDRENMDHLNNHCYVILIINALGIK